MAKNVQEWQEIGNSIKIDVSIRKQLLLKKDSVQRGLDPGNLRIQENMRQMQTKGVRQAQGTTAQMAYSD